ncbi:ankyrin repeat [Fusarium subglutinans]|uniref:Ankyrin repeat n=1 Tax=Gibberella subglutinans TaxID=42677 RepID=A0A8H5V0F5_GIBSU|nr:ankyrin repeat [Fusarium subglutinans]KAF5605986.1 ankyrin repeat [Fusarium subglutinans]
MSNSKWSIRKVVRSLVPTSVQPANVTIPGEDSTVALVEQPIHEPVLTTPGYHGPAEHEKPLWEEQLDESDLDLAPDDPILLWNKAYNAIKRNNGDLVTTFEKILKEDIIGGDSGENQVGFSDINGQYRLVLMKLAVEKSIQKVKTHEAVKEGVLTLSTLVVDLKGVGDAIMSSQPPAAMAWSGICAILPILTRSLLQEQAMVEGLNHVISKMEWYLGLGSYVVMDQWQDNRQLSKLKATLEKRILNVYESMLEYQMRSVTHCYDKHPVIRGVKTILGSNDWRTRNKELEKRERDAEKELLQYSDWHGNSIFGNIARNTETTLAHLRHQFGQTKLGERATAIGRFKTTCYEQLMEAIPPRVPGTCEWLRKHAKFTEWNQQKFGLLLISAGPGCGKSVLARYLVQDVLPFGDPAATVAYFFFSENERSIPNALSAMIHQILCSLSSLFDSCIAEVQALGPNLLSDLGSLWRMFELIVGHPNKRQIVCVLDALNECGDAERKKFNQLLRKFLCRKFSHPPRVKFLIMTREDPDILEDFRGFESMHSVQLSEESKKRDVAFEGCDVPVQLRSIDLLEDINVVIAHHLRQLLLTKAMTQDTWQLVASALEQSPSEPRTYLWVSSVFDVLEQNLDDTVKKWEQLVQRPPGTLFRAYEDMLRDISEEERRKVTRLFRLMIAAEKPMALHELNVALHVQDRRTVYLENDMAHPSNKSFQKWLARTCGGFVAEFDNRIMFVHRSAKAFLLSPDDKSASRQEIERGTYLWQGSITIVQAHRTAAESCILYLSLGVLSTAKFRDLTRVFNKALGEAQVMLRDRSLRPDEFLDHAYDQCEQAVRDQGLSTYSLYSLRNWASHFYCAQEF